MSHDESKIRLVRMSVAHLEATCRWLNQSAQLRRQIDCLSPPTADENRAYWLEKWSDPSRESYAIETVDGRHVGNCGLCNIDHRRSKAQLWIYLGESRGRGHGSAAVIRLLQRGFDELALNRIFLRVAADNLRAIHVYRRIGFVVEGLAREDTQSDGNRVDMVWMGLLAREFHEAARQAEGSR